MKRLLRRFEILLPKRFNDQQSIPEELIIETILELENEFGAVSAETQVTRGHWTHNGQPFRDDLIRIYADVPDTSENLEFFEKFKERLKSRFQQIDIWMATYLIEVL